MYGNHGIRRYRETDLGSMGKEKMVVLLYEKMLEHLDAAATASRAGERIEMSRRLNLTQRIVIELRNALDVGVGGEIARNLISLYDFVFQEILEMLVDQSPDHAANAARVLEPLLAAWRQIPPGTADRAAREHAGAPGTQPAESSAEKSAIGAAPSRAPAPEVPPGVENLLSVSA